jgi:hypothetical protein
MAPTPFEGAFGNIGLIAKTRAALEASCDEAWCRKSVSALQLLEAVLTQVKDLSPMTASVETRRIVGLCGLACATSLERFLQELEKLQPDLDRYFVAGEDRPNVGGPPLWATAVERTTAALMASVGTQLQLTNVLLRVDSLRFPTIRNDIQQILRTPPDLLALETATEAPSQQFIVNGNGNLYQGIHVKDGARAHLGNSYSFLGVPKASVDKLSEKLDDFATSRQADALLSLLREMQKKQNDGCDVLSALNTQTQQILEQLKQLPDAVAIAITHEAPRLPINAQSKQLRKTTPKRRDQLTNLSSALEMIRIWLSTMITMLLIGSRSFQRFIRSTRTFPRSPSMLLNSNITLVDALNRELSLPYEHFRYWPVVLARLKCEFKGFPGESYIAKKKFGLFRAAKKPEDEVMIPFDQWERSVFPGNRVLMSIDVEQFDTNACPACGCALRDIPLMPVFSKWFVTQLVVAMSLILTASKCRVRPIRAHYAR